MMKKNIFAWSLAALFVLPLSLSAADSNKPVKIGVINFKNCVEKSKLGKQEQANFDALKKQLETTVLEKEKTVKSLSQKFNDSDYMDSLSEDASRDLKHKFKTENNELMQMQNQYMQVLQQANFKIVQNLSDELKKASSAVAKNKNLDLILNDETAFYASPSFDVSNEVVVALDTAFDQKKTDEKK